MKRFVDWFKAPAASPVVYASVSHLYFQSVHPYADGNGWIDRLLASSPGAFEGGLSAENYIAMTKCSRATATRDLTSLAQLGVFEKQGVLRHARYFLRDEIMSVITLKLAV